MYNVNYDMHGSAECGTLATEALAADKELRTVEETSGLLASSEYHSSTISGPTDHSTARKYESLAQ